jgi:DNA adenine methylase
MRIRAPFRYSGSNANSVNEIIKFIPYEKGLDWNEVYCGTAVLTLNKPRHSLETINDINDEIFNFFLCLRTNPISLIESIRLTPYSRSELNLAYTPTTIPIERARRFYVKQMMSRNGTDRKPYFKRQFRSEDKSGTPMKPSSVSFADIDHLYKYAERLRGVQIEKRDGIEFIKEFDHKNAVFYIDPPFLPIVRENKDGLYKNEMDENQHIALLETAVNIKGLAIVRHYSCSLYDEYLHDWDRIDFNKRVDGSGSRKESLYISPRISTWLKSNS